MKNFDALKREKEFKNFKKELRAKKYKIDNLSKRMHELYLKISNEYSKKIKKELLNNYINNSINILKASQYLYIPFLGENNEKCGF